MNHKNCHNAIRVARLIQRDGYRNQVMKYCFSHHGTALRSDLSPTPPDPSNYSDPGDATIMFTNLTTLQEYQAPNLTEVTVEVRRNWYVIEHAGYTCFSLYGHTWWCVPSKRGITLGVDDLDRFNEQHWPLCGLDTDYLALNHCMIMKCDTVKGCQVRIPTAAQMFDQGNHTYTVRLTETIPGWMERAHTRASL